MPKQTKREKHIKFDYDVNDSGLFPLLLILVPKYFGSSIINNNCRIKYNYFLSLKKNVLYSIMTYTILRKLLIMFACLLH